MITSREHQELLAQYDAVAKLHDILSAQLIAEGKMQSDGTFMADTVLAKHDENYMPKEVADKLKEQGYWQGQEAKAAQ